MPVRPTKATEKLITLAEVLLGCRYHKGDVKRLIAKAFESENPADTISSRSLETIISAARANLALGQPKTRDELREEARQFYDSVLRNPGAKVREKILAQAQLDRLMGLRAPTTHLLDGAIENAVVVTHDFSKMSNEELKTLERIAVRIAGSREDSGGTGSSKPQ